MLSILQNGKKRGHFSGSISKFDPYILSDVVFKTLFAVTVSKVAQQDYTKSTAFHQF